MRLRNLIAVCLLVVTSSGAWAQTLEITPFAGYRFGGGFSNIGPGGTSSGDLSIDHAVNFGVVVDLALMENVQLEFLFDRQDSELNDVGVASGIETPLFDTKVNYYHAGFALHAKNRAQPFVGVTTGATHFQTPEGIDDELRYSMGLALGIKPFFSQQVGARLQTRLVGTYIGSSDRLLCDSSGCYSKLSDTIMRQLDISGGLVLRF